MNRPEYLLKRRYGVTRAEYDAMLKAQEHACLVCSAGIVSTLGPARRGRGPRPGAARVLTLADRIVLVCAPCHVAAMALNRDAARALRLANLLAVDSGFGV